MDIQLGNPGNARLLAAAVGGLLLTLFAIIARRRSAARFASPEFLATVIPQASTFRNALSGILVSLALALLAVALMDIRWGKAWRDVPQKGIEVVFALDVSRSMLAEDVSPNRLARAKQQIKEMVDAMAGDRVGLVVFAGDARRKVPLTRHYEDFKQVLDEVGPHSIPMGGSRLGDAIDRASSCFLSKTHDHKAIVVFTDGEDQESEPLAVAKRVYVEDGARIFTVGLGDMDQGARIPDKESGSGRFVKHNGQLVWSKMNGQVLGQIAADTNGAYIPAGTKRVNMSDVYHRFVANVPPTEFESAKINGYIVQFQWFALPALGLLLIEIWVSTAERKYRSRTSRSLPTARPVGQQSLRNKRGMAGRAV